MGNYDEISTARLKWHGEALLGDRFVLWVERLATFFGDSFFPFLLVHVAR